MHTLFSIRKLLWVIRKHTGKEGWKKEGEMECVLALTQPSFCALERREIKFTLYSSREGILDVVGYGQVLR